MMTTSTPAPAPSPASTDGPGRRAAVVYNPIKVDLASLKTKVAQAAGAAGWQETLWFETSEDDPGKGAAQEALSHDVDMVIAAGGDGTVRAVAEGMSGSGVSLGLLPSGTGNLLARNLKLTLNDVEHSLEAAFSGRDRTVDLAAIEILREDETRDKHVFVVMAGVGIDAKMLANTDSELKKRVGWLAYVDAIFKALRDRDQLRLRYRLDGRSVHRRRAHTLIVGNCGSLPANILLLPDAAVDDGILDVVLMRPEGILGWLQIWLKVAWENGVVRRTAAGRRLMGPEKEVRALEYRTAEEVVVRLEKEEDIELDGDPFGRALGFKIQVLPGGLTVRVPQDS
jgi:diacylglycerol kinase (ATP)